MYRNQVYEEVRIVTTASVPKKRQKARGQVPYLATDTMTQLPVVIQQFQFDQLGASWTESDAVKSEMQVLRSLKSPNIPRYLNLLETPTGFGLVQEMNFCNYLRNF